MEQPITPKIEAQQPEAASGDSVHPPTRLAWVLLGLIVLSVAALRVRLLAIPLDRDEGEYGYMGQLILRGELPYAAAYSMKYPGVFYSYALILAVFGETPSGIRLGLLVVNGASIILLFLLGSRLFDTRTGLAAAATFGLLSLDPAVLGFTANTEPFVVLAMLGGVLLLVQAVPPQRPWLVLGSGLLFGLSVLMKQHAIAFVAFGGLFLLVESWKQGRPSWRPSLWAGLLFAAGVFLPFALLCWYLAARGAFEPFWFWTFTYACHYTSMTSLGQGMQELGHESAHVVGSAVAFWGLTVLGLSALFWDRLARRRVLFLGLFAGFSFLAICPGLLFRAHYFILLLPAASLLAGVGVGALGRLGSRPWVARRASGGILIAALALVLLQQRHYLFLDPPDIFARSRYGPNPFFEALEMARYIRAHSHSDDIIAVVGSEPEIYFYTGRRAGTGFLYTYPLMEPQPFALQMQKDMIAQIERAAPRFLVIVNVPFSWLRRPRSPTLIFGWSARYVKTHYRCVGVANLLSEQLTEYRWGAEAEKYRPRSPYYLYLFERIAPAGSGTG